MAEVRNRVRLIGRVRQDSVTGAVIQAKDWQMEGRSGRRQWFVVVDEDDNKAEVKITPEQETQVPAAGTLVTVVCDLVGGRLNLVGFAKPEKA